MNNSFAQRPSRSTSYYTFFSSGCMLNRDGSLQTPGTVGKITLAAVKDTDYLSIENKGSSTVWQSQGGNGHYNETIKLANISAGKGLSVNASGGIVVELPKVSAATPAATPQFDEAGKPLPPPPPPTAEEQAAQRQAALDQHIHTLASQPGQEWIGQLTRLAKEKPDSVKIQQVAAAAQHWNYSAEGLTPEGAAVVVIAVTYFTAGAASGAATTMTGAAVGTTTVASAAIAAGLTTLATQAAVTIINNQGDVGKTLEDMGKSENIRAVVTAMVTAGALQGLNQSLGMSKVNAKSTFTEQLQKNVINNTASALVNHAINGGDLQQQLEQSLKSAFIDTGAAQGANWIGDMKDNGKLNDFTHQLAHAIAGCAAGMARSDDCGSGALGAVVGEISAELYGGNRTNANNLDVPALQTDTVNFAKLMAGVAAAITGKDVNLAAGAGGNAAENNYLNHLPPKQFFLSEADQYAAAVNGCAGGDSAACTTRDNLAALSQSRDKQVASDCNNGGISVACADGVVAATSNGSQLKHTSDGKLIVTSPEYDFYSGNTGEMRNINDPRTGTFHQDAAQSLSQSLPVLAVIAAPEIVATLGTGKMFTGAIVGAGFDAAGQYTQLQFQPDDNYRPLQTVVAGMTGAIAFPLSGSSVFGDAVIGGMVNATNTAMTNDLYGKNDSVVWAGVFGAGFAGLGAYAGRESKIYTSNILPTNIGATYINPNVPIFQQTINLGVPNPYPSLIETVVSNTIGATPSFISLPGSDGGSK